MRFHPPVLIPGYEAGGIDEPFTDEEIYSILVREPFCLRPWEISQLDRYQIYHVYLRPRGEDGMLIRSRPSVASFGTVPYSVMFRQVWKKRGKTDEEINELINQDESLVEAIVKGDA